MPDIGDRPREEGEGISLGGRLSRIGGIRVFAAGVRLAPVPPSDASHRANYLITAADQSSARAYRELVI